MELWKLTKVGISEWINYDDFSFTFFIKYTLRFYYILYTEREKDTSTFIWKKKQKF